MEETDVFLQGYTRDIESLLEYGLPHNITCLYVSAELKI